MSNFPYTDKFAPIRYFPEGPTDQEEILSKLTEIAKAEDSFWETGKCSGTIYSGDHAHYEFLNKVFGLFSHANALQRDMCPSATMFEAEIIAMTLDLFNSSAITNSSPGGLVTSGGTSSIFHALYAYREYFSKKGREEFNIICPETAHPAFYKSAHILNIKVKKAPVDPRSAKVDTDWVEKNLDQSTMLLVGSACNYGYGIIDPIAKLSEIAISHEIFLHVDACLGGFILPFGEQLGYDIEPFDYRIPGVTSISSDTHKYGYSLKGTSVVTFRDKKIRNAQYFYDTDWSGGKYCSPSFEGSRSVGLLAATWAAMVKYGRSGYLKIAEEIFSTASQMIEVVKEFPELYIIGKPTFLFSFSSNDFDIYHVNDFMRNRGWRFNGQQYPNALHMAVTRPQTKEGLVGQFKQDLKEAVEYAKQNKDNQPFSGAIYGGIPGGITLEADQFIKSVMEDLMDSYQEIRL